MKKFSLILLLLASFNVFAQIDDWQDDESDTDYQQMINSAFFRTYDNLNFQSMTVDELKNISFKNAAPMTFKVFIHDMDNQRLNECDYLYGIRYLNAQFNQFHIYFKYIGYDTDGYDNTTNLPIPNVFNVYLTPGSGGLAGGYENIRIGQICFDESMQPPAIHASTIAHEFGHTLSLLHTFEGTVGSTRANLTTPIISPCDGSEIRQAYFPNFSSNSENVTRDPNDPNYNADTKGDAIADTPAMMHASNHCTDYVNYELNHYGLKVHRLGKD